MIPVPKLDRSLGVTAETAHHLSYAPPYDWDAALRHLGDRAIDGVERVVDGVYRRTIAHGGAAGAVEVRHDPRRAVLAVTIRFPRPTATEAIVARVRRVFDVDADVVSIGAHLARDPLLAPLVAARPGLRVPGAWDGFELAVRAVLGQQITVVAARRIAGRLVERCGERAEVGDGLTRLFPTAARVAAADLDALGMPRARRDALVAIATASLAEPEMFDASDGGLDATVERLCAIRGIGAWTAHYIALRAGRDGDAFPANDVALLRGAATDAANRPTPAALRQRAEAWRPWRAYAAQHLWTSLAMAKEATRG